MIERGEKTEEYREFKPYWASRLLEWYYMTDSHHVAEERITLDQAAGICGDHIEALLMTHPRKYDVVCFSYGYTKRRMLWEYKDLVIGRGRPEWGAPDYNTFIIKLGKRL